MGEFDQTSGNSFMSTPSPNRLTSSQLTPATTETNLVPITSHELNGHNYLQWSQSMMMFISGQDKDEYLTGDIQKPDSKDVEYRTWRSENNLVMSWLISSMTTEIGEKILLYTTAKDIWEAAKETFSSSENTAELFQMENTLRDLCQRENSMTIYFTTLTHYWQQLDLFEVHEWKCVEDRAYFKKIVETKRVFKFFMGLDKSHDKVRGRILGTKPLPNLREVFSEVRREESRKWVMLGHQASLILEIPAFATIKDAHLHSGAFVVRSNSQNYNENRSRKGHPWYDHCRRPGHLKEIC
ncbi:uncharacterized protein LOC141660440 [Apium graveolens]|uniref:uncharacterized protein LOC141660440 n=1 Tax=Apium graveolens TaxID=4045 RepID=UPI003D79E375